MNTEFPAPKFRGPGVVGMWLIALFPLLNLLVFTPVTIYLANADEFEFGIVGLLPALLGLAMAAAVLLAAPGMLLRPAGRARLAVVLFTLGVLTWLQGAFLMYDYGVLDGRGIDWQDFSPLVSADVLLWVAVLAAAVLLARRLSRVVVFGAVTFMVLQAVPLLTDLAHERDEVESAQDKAAMSDIVGYSTGRNVLHLVLDNFQTDIFKELVTEKQLQQVFDGFVLLEDNVAASPHTSLAIPAILSGGIYDGSMPASEYYREAMGSGLNAALLERGFEVNLVPLMSMRDAPATRYFEVPTPYASNEQLQRMGEGTFLLDVSLFRLLPHELRRWVYREGNWRISNLTYNPASGKGFQHRQFLADYIDQIEVRTEVPTYHFVHLWPPHPPFTTTAAGRHAGSVLPNTRENYLNEARPVVMLLADLIARLKDLEIYDDTLIILQSDHGGGFEPDGVANRALGLFAVKPLSSRGAMRVSSNPTTTADTPATVMGLLGLEGHGFPGRPALAASTGESERTRRFVYIQNGELRRIMIRGSANDPESYSESIPVQMQSGPRAYRYGESVKTGLLGIGGRYLGEGWASQADRHVWSNGGRASLALQVQPPPDDLRLTVDLMPHIDEEILPRQRIRVNVNGRRAGEWTATRPGRHSFAVDIPQDWVAAEDLDIEFELPDSASPAVLGTGGDERELGIAIIGFRIDDLASAQDAEDMKTDPGEQDEESR